MSAHPHSRPALGSPAANDGGPAFPVQELNADGTPYALTVGMSLRDYFAGQALVGLIAQSMGTAGASNPQHGAEYAYAMADAMLAARNARSPA